MNYEYAPVLEKKAEKAIAFLLLFLGLLLFGFSQIPNIPLPFIYQFLGIFALASFVILLARYLMRRYAYRVEPRTAATMGMPFDFVVTEYYGRRITVVCRVSVADIEEILPITKQNRKEIAQKQKGRFFYDYTADLFSKNRFLITVRDGEHLFSARILADENLLSLLKS